MDRGKLGTVKKKNGGETLVEAIISFALVLIVLLSVTTMVRASISINRTAGERMAGLETEMSAIEEDGGPAASDTANGSVAVEFLGERIEVPVVIKTEGDLTYFAPIPGGLTP
ncbi:hypothetical protein [Gehongia tenuis]|uniref:Uncharacterized protein n=1 Tax=Gehongia tenuis TaxID=2763655 RepID=A0A926D3Z9_9FIRM|nr:hypothetical protein [Gehongia tenuis]MBC8531067.1 hypothetical protein [Gehongia tenuis]